MRLQSILTFALLAASALPLAAQLTPEQKTADFRQLAAVYAKNYGPYGWKIQAYNYDLLKIQPWLDKVAKTKNDLEFLDVCVDYVAALNDGHDYFYIPSDFSAYLHFDVDIYDSKVLIEYIDRSYLPRAQFPFVVGDEIVSVDGVLAEDFIQSHTKYSVWANTSANRRAAADQLTFRYQAANPFAAQIGTNAAVVVKRQSTGATETYQIPWDTAGIPITAIGPVPNPKTASVKADSIPIRFRRGSEADRAGDNPWGADFTAKTAPDENLTELEATLREAQDGSVSPDRYGLTTIGRFTPIFTPPANFKLRLGGSRSDYFVSGTIPLNGSTVGFIRIPDFQPASQSAAFTQWVREISYFQDNTDALVIDTMYNPGGNLCWAQTLVSTLVQNTFHGIGYEIRATQYWVNIFASRLAAAKATKAEQWVIDLYSLYLTVLQQAAAAPRGQTGAIPICGPSIDTLPATDTDGNIFGYTKPVVLITNEFTGSSGDAFAAMLQDAGRGTQFGVRTAGLGGNPAFYLSGNYSETEARATRTLIVRKNPVVTPDFPTAPYFENIGVRPDVVVDYMTKDNLLTGGKSFVDSLLKTVQNAITSGGK